MKQDEAFALREEILHSCKDLPESSVGITEIKIKNGTVQSYQLYVLNVSFSSKLCLQAIAKKHRLIIREQNGITILYKPMLVAFI